MIKFAIATILLLSTEPNAWTEDDPACEEKHEDGSCSRACVSTINPTGTRDCVDWSEDGAEWTECVSVVCLTDPPWCFRETCTASDDNDFERELLHLPWDDTVDDEVSQAVKDGLREALARGRTAERAVLGDRDMWFEWRKGDGHLDEVDNP